MELGIAFVVGIAAVCYVIGMGIKTYGKIDKWIPFIVTFCGGVLGIVAMYTNMPDFPANDIINAFAIGAASGSASTAVNQMYKQMSKGE